jgi:hypothetical protein
MKTKTKVIIGAAAAVVLLIVLGAAVIIGAGAYVFSKVGSPEQVARSHKAKADGAAYGATVDQQGCMVKGYTLDKPADSFDLSGEEYVKACLKASRPTPNFCDGVPFVLDRKWFADECQKAGQDTEACITAFIAKRNFCLMDRRS